MSWDNNSQFQKTQFSIKENTPNFVTMEEQILQFWKEIGAFELQLKETEGLPKYTFYDGPPFATGLPHYGHICAGTIKDVITRYASMTGHHVERRFGWDCHGLPIEFQIDKELGIKNRNEIVELGIDKYNDKCKAIVMKYSGQWRTTIERLGRWIDFDNDYKTMDRSFMESVWWVFKEIYKKGLVYRGCKIMPYSNACMTVLSNFEAQQNYVNIKDPAIIITFPLKSDNNVEFLAWTTTPWTLPSNLALTVNPNFTYCKIKDTKSGRIFILAKSRLVQLYKTAQSLAGCEDKNYKAKKDFKSNEFEILEEFKGQQLENTEYVPLFDYYYEKMQSKGCFRVLCADFVTSDSGTGIVHTAPGFGVDDYSVARKYNIIVPDDPCVCVDDSGFFLDIVKDFSGKYIKDADPLIIHLLKDQKRLIRHDIFEHSYPMCWRSDTPLIYKAVNCWFIRVTDIKERLLKNNLESKWVPTFAQVGRFQQWLENAVDWCFSRNRYWGNPIPLWASEDFEEIVCIGSVEELIELAGLPKDTIIEDLHMQNIDHITIPSKMGKGVLKRIPETFDCWFESGSMPYAQKGYPFKMSEEEFKKRFPAEFIGEGIDQTRGWFYTLNVLGTILFDQCPFKNLIVNGIVKAADGKKLSKRLMNYTDPLLLVNKYGADALRLYLMNSPLVKGQDLRFKDEEVFQLLTQIFVPWYQLIRLLNQEINRYENLTQTKFIYQEHLFMEEGDYFFENIFDQWILAKTQDVLEFVHQEFGHYRLYTVLQKQLQFLRELSNWYVNMNKKRFKGENNPQEAFVSLNVFYHSFYSSILSMSPYVPFIVESFYQDLKKVMKSDSNQRKESIHLLTIPKPTNRFKNQTLVEGVEIFQKLISSIRKERDLRNISRKYPFKHIEIHPRHHEVKKVLQTFEPYIKEEGNVQEVVFGDEFEKFVQISFKPNIEVLKEQITDKSKFGKLFPQINKMSQENINEFLKKRQVHLEVQFGTQNEQFELNEENLLVVTQIVQQPSENHLISGEEDFVYDLDIKEYPELDSLYLSREITSRIQKSRKDGLVDIHDQISIILDFPESSANLKEVFSSNKQNIDQVIKKPVFLKNEAAYNTFYIQQHEIKHQSFNVIISLGSVTFNPSKIENYENFKDKLLAVFSSMSLTKIQKQEKIDLFLGGKKFELIEGEHFVLHVQFD